MSRPFNLAGTRAIAEKHPGSWPFWLNLIDLLDELDALRATLVVERAKTADVLGARDVLRDWLDGHDNGYPLNSDDWEGDVVERARVLLSGKGETP